MRKIILPEEIFENHSNLVDNVSGYFQKASVDSIEKPLNKKWEHLVEKAEELYFSNNISEKLNPGIYINYKN